MADAVDIVVDGRELRVTAGTSVAAALVNARVAAFRRSPTGEPRWPVCGIGVCFECRVAIDGVPNRRSCLVTCADGMTVTTDA